MEPIRDRELHRHVLLDLNRSQSRPAFCSSHNRRRESSGWWVLLGPLDSNEQTLLSLDERLFN